MRDVLLTLLVGGLLPFALFRPFAGLLILTGLAYFRPQEMCWGFARELPFSLVVAGATVLGLVLGRFAGPPFRRGEARLPVDRRITLLVLFWAALLLSTLLAAHRSEAAAEMTETSKVMVFALLTAGLTTTRDRFRWVLLVIAASLGLLALKHGLHALVTGRFRIFHGPGGMMADSNDFGLALVMTLPLLFHLGASRSGDGGPDLSGPAAKAAFGFLGIWAAAGVLLTHSRGGFLALAVVTILWMLRFRRKAWALVLGPVLLAAAALALPAEVVRRGEGILTGRPDLSARMRAVAWRKALHLGAARPLFGVGPGNFILEWENAAPSVPGHPVVVHNTYLQVFAEAGGTGLVLYLLLLVATLGGLRLAGGEGSDRWRREAARALELSLAGFLVGALFLSRVRFDLFYQLVALAAALGPASNRRETAAELFAFWRTGGSRTSPHPRAAVGT